jgi:hypothetical protein
MYTAYGMYWINQTSVFDYNHTTIAKAYTDSASGFLQTNITAAISSANSSAIAWTQTYHVNKTTGIMNAANITGGNITDVVCNKFLSGGYICDNGTATIIGHS